MLRLGTEIGEESTTRGGSVRIDDARRQLAEGPRMKSGSSTRGEIGEEETKTTL